MNRSIIAAAMLFGTVLTAHAETDVWVDIRKPWRSNAEMDGAVKAEARICERDAGIQRGPLTAKFKQCMLKHHWRFSHAVPTSPLPIIVRHGGTPVDNSNDDTVRRQRDQDNIQQMINNQQMFNNQQMLNDQQFQQNQQQMLNNQ